MDRYGDEIEYDLHAELGLDLLDFLRGHHPWGKLLRLVEQLPRGSRYQAARAEDDEIAEQWLEMFGDEELDKPSPPSFVGYDLKVEALLNLTDSIQELHATLVAANAKGGKRPKVRPSRRPVTAIQTAQRRRNKAEAEKVRDLFAPREG